MHSYIPRNRIYYIPLSSLPLCIPNQQLLMFLPRMFLLDLHRMEGKRYLVYLKHLKLTNIQESVICCVHYLILVKSRLRWHIPTFHFHRMNKFKQCNIIIERSLFGYIIFMFNFSGNIYFLKAIFLVTPSSSYFYSKSTSRY